MDDDEVLLNVSPNKFEKPKDQLYMDFFVKYTKLFVDEAQNSPSKQKNKFSKDYQNDRVRQQNSRIVPQANKGRMRLEATPVCQ